MRWETDTSHTLPIVNAPAHEWATLVTVLENMYKLNKITCPDDRSPVMLTLDMDLYKRALKLEYISDKYQDAFHTSLCEIRFLGKTIEHSGLDESWVISGMYSQVTVNQIVNGSHYNRAVTAHEVTLQALFDLWVDSFFQETPRVMETLNTKLEKMTDACKLTDDTARQKATQHALNKLLINIESMNIEKQILDFDN